RPAGHVPGRVALAARLVHDRRDDPREGRCVELVPHPTAQALGDEQVVLGVDPAQHLPLARDLLPVGREVAEPREEAARTVEVARDRVGAALDPPYERRVLALEPAPSPGPAGAGLARGASGAGLG